AAAYTRSLGADGPPCSYDDLDAADCFLLVGANTADCHPVLFKRLRRRKAAAPDEVGVIVVDPRWTETADVADLHLPVRPGSDVALLNGMLHVLDREGLLDRAFIAAHTSGWDDVARAIADYPPARAGALIGLAPESLVTAAMWFGRARRRLRRARARSHRAGRTAVRPRAPGAHALEHGREPEPPRHRQGDGHPQPASRDGSDRTARRRAVLADRPAERDGRTRDGRA